MEEQVIGDKNVFAVGFSFHDKQHVTELSMYVRGKNILAFNRAAEDMTTCWKLDELAEWLRAFLNGMQQDPYPVEVAGRFAVEKDVNARTYDTDDMEAFDAYYDALDDWNARHRWHTASAGAILADVYFQSKGDTVEISWNNQDAPDEIKFQEQIGGTAVQKDVFVKVVDAFLQAYAEYWF